MVYVGIDIIELSDVPYLHPFPGLEPRIGMDRDMHGLTWSYASFERVFRR